MTAKRTRGRLMDEQSAVTSRAALAQGMRLRIFRALVGAGPQCLTPGALAAMLDVPGSTLSFHPRELMHAGVVSQKRDGCNLFYRPSLEQMHALLLCLTAPCCQAFDGTTRDVGKPPGCTTCGASASPGNITCPGAAMSQNTPATVYNVLFICTHDSARSIMAEGLMSSLGRGGFKAWSAGSRPVRSTLSH